MTIRFDFRRPILAVVACLLMVLTVTLPSNRSVAAASGPPASGSAVVGATNAPATALAPHTSGRENSTPYKIGLVLGRLLVFAAIIAGIVYLVRRKKRQQHGSAPMPPPGSPPPPPPPPGR